MRRQFEQCPVKGCTAKLNPKKGMCAKCYSMIPETRRAEVWMAWCDGIGSTGHRLAIARALLWHTDAGKLYGSDG